MAAAFVRELGRVWRRQRRNWRTVVTRQIFNRFFNELTLQYANIYITLLKTRLMNDGLDPDEDQLSRFKEHIERGVTLFHNWVKEFPDLVTLT